MAGESQIRAYREMNRDQLEALARQHGVPGIENKSKDELIQNLEYHARPHGTSEPSGSGPEGGNRDTSPIKGTNPGQWKDIPGNRRSGPQG